MRARRKNTAGPRDYLDSRDVPRISRKGPTSRECVRSNMALSLQLCCLLLEGLAKRQICATRGLPQWSLPNKTFPTAALSLGSVVSCPSPCWGRPSNASEGLALPVAAQQNSLSLLPTWFPQRPGSPFVDNVRTYTHHYLFIYLFIFCSFLFFNILSYLIEKKK